MTNVALVIAIVALLVAAGGIAYSAIQVGQQVDELRAALQELSSTQAQQIEQLREQLNELQVVQRQLEEARRELEEVVRKPTPITRTIRFVTTISSPLPFGLVQEVALDAGFFAEEGLAVEFMRVRGAPSGVKAVVTGDADIGWAGSIGVWKAIEEGAPIKVVGGVSRHQPYFIAAKEDIRSIADLKGKTFAIARPGDIITVLTIPFNLYPQGITEKDLNIVAIGSPPARYQALVAGQVDATVLTIEFLPILPEGLHSLTEVPQPPIAIDWIIARTDTIEKDPELVLKVMRAYIKGARLIASNPDAFIATAVNHIGTKTWTRDHYRQAWEVYTKLPGGYWPVNGGIDRKSIEETVVKMKELGVIRSTGPLEKFIDFSFVDRVLQELGRWPSEYPYPSFR